MAKTVTLNSIDPISFEYQEYSIQDGNLIVNFTVEPTFNPLKNYVAYYIYDLNNTVVFSNEIDFRGYSIINNQVVLTPEADIEAVGFEEGQYNVVYNFLNNELSSSYFQRLYIDQISSDRTEVRLNTTQISNLDLISGATSLSAQIQSSAGVYFDFFLDFGDNQLVIANNILLDTSNPEDPTVLIKLYEPLPVDFSLKDECWVVTQVADSIAYNINITQTFELIDENIYLRGPNYNLGIKDQINNSTDYVNYSTLSSTSSYDASTSSSLNYQINSILAERGVEINVDYSDYNNFIYFSSAETRLENFYYKLQLIEEYTYSASLSNNSTNSYSVTSSTIWQAKINEIITTFDGYDYFLYYNSGSGAWPKTNSTYPYNNVTTTSVAGINFFATQSALAIEFDENNNNALINAIPTYLRDDAANAQYELFIEMLGEMFDNIWIYYQDVTNKWNADNRLNYGVSKDLVAEILRDLGLKIYQNNFSSNDLYLAFLGVTSEGNTFPFPNITGSYPVPSGYEYIDTKVSASNTIVPLEDIEYSFYKRLYHNLPLLLKKKGTTTGLQNLITTYGIPSTILRVAEFGGKDKDESNDWDYYKQRYNYKLDTVNNPSVETEWALNPSWGSLDDVPNTLQFRFRAPSSGSTGAVNYAVTSPDTVLWSLNDGSQVAIVLEYTGSGFTTGSYSGSIINPFYQYANLKFTADGLTTSASVYLPFFNGDWWSVMVTRTGSDYFTLYAADSIYNGDDGTSIGFIASSSYTDNGGGLNWVGMPPMNSYFGANGDSITLSGSFYNTFSGSYQEIRYYTVGLSSSVFEDYTMNPDSIEGNSLNSAPDQLAFRASLGGELFTGSVSIHPKVTGFFPTTSSFTSDSNFATGSSVFTSNIETVYLDQPAAGIKNIVSNKIQIGDMTLPAGNTLSKYRSIQQQPPGGSIYTENLSYTEIAFSPQNEINDDIMAQLGFFNMGEFIGDPRQRFTPNESYPDLDALRNEYFKKYISNYNIFEYVNLIKYFDNSLFKMIKDFTPARASLASGVVIKQHLLERNKYPQPEVTQSLNDFSGSIDTAFILGGAGGSVNNLNGLDTNPYYIANGLSNVYGVTQSWSEGIITPYGLDVQTHSSQDEFYNGEYSGSEFTVEDGELNEANPFKQTNIPLVTYDMSGSNGNSPTAGNIFWRSTTLVDNSGNITGFGVGSMYINEISENGVNNQVALSSLTVGDKINFTVRTDGIEGGLPCGTPKNTTVTQTIFSIAPRGNGIWYIQFRNDSVIILYSANTGFCDQGITYLNLANQTVNLLPYLSIPGFYNSDYNAIINNSEFNRLSDWRQQVDYISDQLIPTNFQAIISGTATPASVQDSNYTSYQYSGIRYIGSKNTTDNFNNASTTVSSNIENQTNTDLGNTTLGLPSVDLNRTYFVYFNWAGGTAPEWGTYNEDRTTYNIRYFIDESGNVIRPLNDSEGINLGIIRQNFTEGEIAVSALNNTNIFGTELSVLNGAYPIFKSGKTIQPILYSQTQSTDNNGNVIGYGFTSSISFNVQLGTTSVPNYGFLAYKSTTQTSNNIPEGVTNNILITFPAESYDYSSYYNTSTSIYTFGADTEVAVSFRTSIRHTVDFLWEDPFITPGQSMTIQFAIQSGSGATWTDLATKNVLASITTTGVLTTTLATPSRFFKSGDNLRVVMKTYNLSTNPFNETANMSFLANSTFSNFQNQGGFTVPTASVGYWTTGSTPSNVLTASAELTNLYGYRQDSIYDSGFNPINYRFEIQPYDEIRFEAIEPNSYTIVSASFSDKLHLFLDRNITPPGTNINFFLIRRYVDDPAFITLDVDKPAGDSGTGILKPEYLLTRIEGKIDNILEDLQERGLIQD